MLRKTPLDRALRLHRAPPRRWRRAERRPDLAHPHRRAAAREEMNRGDADRRPRGRPALEEIANRPPPRAASRRSSRSRSPRTPRFLRKLKPSLIRARIEGRGADGPPPAQRHGRAGRPAARRRGRRSRPRRGRPESVRRRRRRVRRRHRAREGDRLEGPCTPTATDAARGRHGAASATAAKEVAEHASALVAPRDRARRARAQAQGRRRSASARRCSSAALSSPSTPSASSSRRSRPGSRRSCRLWLALLIVTAVPAARGRRARA